MAARLARTCVIAAAALACCSSRSTHAFTACARSKPNPRQSRIPLSFGLTKVPKLPAAAAAAAATATAATSSGFTPEATEQDLRQALPDFRQDVELREALARCEADMLADEAVSNDDGDVPATRCAGLPVPHDNDTVGSRPASSSSMSSSCPPVDGLRRFSRDGVDGVFMGAAGVPLRYRL